MEPLPSFGAGVTGDGPLSRLTPTAPPPLTGQGSHWDGTGAVPYMKREVRDMEYTKAEYIRFIGELLELLPEGFVRKIYSIVAIERRRAGG